MMQALSYHHTKQMLYSSDLLSLNCNDKQVVSEAACCAIATPAKIKILLVEDEHINQMVAKTLLENKNYQVTIASTGQAALSLYQTHTYAAILMDMGLPDISGLEVTRQIRIIEQETAKHTPIIALTAHGEMAKQECLNAGMDDFTTKPIDIEHLNQRIQNWIEKSKD